ncbi:hypothetical protein [Demequina sp. NBRC 110051]|uniref:hypothetical protein n=1 Tax=Demequina sp. NBRC 110051 TaxID=1570340 RepID=UPI00117D478E|nr:hypothetical protein [Demequina sp. NBRC 110051]
MAVSLVLAGCSANGGSLVAGDGGIFCAPRDPGSTKYFGTLLTNSGNDPITLTGVAWEDEMVDDAGFLIDLDGDALAQLVGTMTWPTDEPYGYEEDLLARAVPVEGAVIPAGVTANMLVTIEPASATDDAVITETQVSYREGLGHTATNSLTMVPATEAGCDMGIDAES